MTKIKQQRIFKTWLEEHKSLLFKIIRVYAKSEADRDDLFQEISIQLWRSIPNFREESAVTTWLYRVALNTAIKWNRDERKHQDGRQPFENAFDRSMLGELNHGIATATYQVRLSQIMRWYAVPVGILTALAVWQSQTSLWIPFLVLLIFGFAWYAGGWEHHIYIKKKRELEVLRNKLAKETNSTELG